MVHCVVVVDVYRERDFFYYVEGVGESAFEGGDYDDGVDVALELWEGLGENLASCAGLALFADIDEGLCTQYYNCCGSVSYLLILCPAQLYHALCCRMGDFDLS